MGKHSLPSSHAKPERARVGPSGKAAVPTARSKGHMRLPDESTLPKVDEKGAAALLSTYL